jgi:hypothetical protein
MAKFSFTKCQTSKLESKNYKQATPYVKPSPAITGISGVRSNFILPFGSWLFTTNKWITALPPTKKGSYNFSLRCPRKSIYTVDESIECCLSITPA